MESLVYSDKLSYLACCNKIVKIFDGFAAHKLAPRLGFVGHGEEVGAFLVCGNSVGILHIGVDEDKSFRSRKCFPRTKVTCRGRHLAVVVIEESVVFVNIDSLLLSIGEKGCLVMLANALVVFDKILSENSAALQGEVLCNDFAHFRFKLLKREVLYAGNLEVKT